jgi:O-antigen ligase
VQEIPNRLWRGHGYWAFWNEPTLSDPVLLAAGSAHNAVLEVLLGLGIIGLVPFAATAGLAVVQSGRGVHRRIDVASVWWATVVVVALLENATESFVLWYSYLWVLLIAASVASPKAEADMPPRQVEVADAVISSSN